MDAALDPRHRTSRPCRCTARFNQSSRSRAAIMYAPQHRPGLKVDLLMEEKLVLVTTQPGAALSDDAGYVHVDWGPEFALHHAMNFSEDTPALFIDLGPLALSYILSTGGSGYFRMSAVEP